MRLNLAAAEPEPEADAKDEKRETLERIASDLAEMQRQVLGFGDERLAVLITNAWQEAASRLLK